MASFASVFIVILIIITSITTSTAKIRSSVIRSDSRRIIPLDEFGFTHNGRLELNVSKLNLSSSLTTSNHQQHYDLSKLGFFLCATSSFDLILYEQDFCTVPLKSKRIKPVYNFSHISKDVTSFNHVYNNSDDSVTYILVFVNCVNQEDVRVSMDVVSAMYNRNGNSRDYLSSGLKYLPMVYFIFSLIYVAISIPWGYVLCRNRLNVYRFHILMLVVVILKSLNLLCEGGGMWYINRSGSDALGWDLSFRIIRLFNGVTFFTLLLWIGSSWKPCLEVKDKKLMIFVIPLQLLANIALVVIDISPLLYGSLWIVSLKQLVWLVDGLCCFLVLFKFVASMDYLEKEALDTTIGPKAAHILKFLNHFRWYFFVFWAYFFFTRIVILGFIIFTPYKYQWTVVVAFEALHLAFFVLTGCIFRPYDQNPYISFDHDVVDLEAGTFQHL